MKKLISMLAVLAMMFAALPICSCSDKDDYGYEMDYMDDINGSWAISTLDGKSFDEFIVFKFTVAGFFFIYNDNVEVYSSGSYHEGNKIYLYYKRETKVEITVNSMTEDTANVDVYIIESKEHHSMDLYRVKVKA